MRNNTIEVFGVTPICDFPVIPPGHPYTEICETDKLELSCHLPDIKQVKQVSVEVLVRNYKVIRSPAGNSKIIVEAMKRIKFLYVAKDGPCLDEHIAEFTIPFCLLIAHDACALITSIKTAIEAIHVIPISTRSLVVASVIFACPIYKDKLAFGCTDNSIQCDIVVNCESTCATRQGQNQAH